MRHSDIVKTIGFGDIETIVLYKLPIVNTTVGDRTIPFTKFFPVSWPENPDALLAEIGAVEASQFKCSGKLYHGSNKNIMETDFSEYDFSYFLKKHKFSNEYNISKLDNPSKELIGLNIDDLSRMESALFPTLSLKESEEDLGFDYFGTILVSNQLLFFLRVPKEIAKIEFYSGVLTRNVIGEDAFYDYDWLKKLHPDLIEARPVCSLYLGPDPECRNNSPYNYYTNDPMRTERLGKYISAIEHSKLQDEITKDKVVWVILSDKGDNIDSLNLSYDSWYNNDNANRNKPLYTLRNDEYWSSLKNIDIVEELEDTNIVRDSRSSFLLGNQAPETFEKRRTDVEGIYDYINYDYPILSRKLNRLEYVKTKYCPSVIYKKGDKVTFGETEWVSLSSGNKGNKPGISNSWIEASKINNFYTTQVKILCEYWDETVESWVMNESCGYLDGMKTIPVTGINDNVEITVVANPGYAPYTGTFAGEACFGLPGGGQLEPSKKPQSSDGWVKSFTITNWSSVLALPDPTIILRFVISPCVCTFLAKVNERLWEYNDDPNLNGWNNIYDAVIYGTGDNKYLAPLFSPFSGGKYYTFSGNENIFDFVALDSYDLKTIEVAYTDGSSNENEEKEKTILPDETYTFKDYVDYRKVTYTLILEDSVKTVDVINSEQYEISLAKAEINYAQRVEVEFYPKPGSSFQGFWVRNKDTGESTGKITSTSTYSLPGMPSAINFSNNTDTGIYKITIEKLIKNIIIEFK